MIFWGFLAFASVFMGLVFQPSENCTKVDLDCNDSVCWGKPGPDRSIIKLKNNEYYWCREQK